MSKHERAAARTPDSVMAGYSADWQSVARYSVYRAEFIYGRGEVKTILHTGKPYDEAKRLQAIVQSSIEQEPDYRANTMSRAIAGIELENGDSTYIAFKQLREERKTREYRHQHVA